MQSTFGIAAADVNDEWSSVLGSANVTRACCMFVAAFAKAKDPISLRRALMPTLTLMPKLGVQPSDLPEPLMAAVLSAKKYKKQT